MADRKPQLLSKAQREAIEKELASPYGKVDLRIDGHKVGLRVERIGPLRYAVVVYLDGWVKGENYKAGSAIGAKFWRPEKVCGLKGKAFSDFTKKWGKREAKKMQAKYSTTIHIPYFRSARGFLSHVQRTCDGIEVVSVGYQPSAPVQTGEVVAHG